MIRAFKKPFMLNLYVTEQNETHARTFLFDATDRNHRETYRIGVMTQDVISDDVRAWADHYAIFVIHPRDLRDIEKLMRETNGGSWQPRSWRAARHTPRQAGRG